MTRIIDGKQIAAQIRADLAKTILETNLCPTLSIVLIGDDPASAIYVRNKISAAEKIGMRAEIIRLAATVPEEYLINYLHDLSADTYVDGIIVQLPLPPHIHQAAVFEAIDPRKDVDGFHPINVGLLTSGSQPDNMPCTPKGIMRLLQAAGTPLEGAQALVVGCSPIVGRPVSTLLSQANATVTTAHKLTRDLAAETQRADLIVVAAGCPNLITGAMIKPGVTIIDVGINRLDDGRICGDVAYDECLGIAGAITPVPGGVGPMTVACLLENTVQSAMVLSDY